MTDNPKPFTTHNQQLKILRSRGLIVKPSANRALEEHGYYSIINGYKKLFLEKDSNGRPIDPERYITGSTFEEIKSLYDFDRELRQILYGPLMEYESNLGAELSYKFSKRYTEPHSYLAMNNFSRNDADAFNVVKTINSLSYEIQKNTKGDNAIRHYINKYGYVPLWVLVNFMTFGELNYFYQNCSDKPDREHHLIGLKTEIAKDFALKYKRNYKQNIQVHPLSIESINTLVNHFRNSVAHSEITYRKIVKKGVNFSSILSDLQIPRTLRQTISQSNRNSSQCGVFELIVSLKLVLNKRQYTVLKKNIQNLISKYQNEFHSVSFTAILNDMHFPRNYDEFL
ncbi:Abi family protein [Lactobacillus sp. ESL0684]|uniref:Abi family protein n=1 Tax=Lactobacillus sp. ESL0684 TaxID=2983213 RepID=UPI0023F86206|nr:Abi family protein [Lactobacillus sp. ESL0684]WEV43007.1 Abi family protein [Lactobacillus sp. ESL0684]